MNVPSGFDSRVSLSGEPEREIRPAVALGQTRLGPQFRYDLRAPRLEELDRFIVEKPVRDWSVVTWKDVGKPVRVENYASGKRRWEEQNGDTMPVKTSWEMFNRSFHSWFVKDGPQAQREAMQRLAKSLTSFRLQELASVFQELEQVTLWNLAHRVTDTIWDPRGKRALFRGLDVTKPRILFLGAAEGYEAMQLYAMYPGGEAVMVDYDAFCRDHRFGEFPEDYPFLGYHPETGSPRAWYKRQMRLTYLVEDIRKLPFGREFDIVLSVGLLEHFPDEYKPECIEWHRKFLRPGGYAILTTPRLGWRTKLFYHVMAEAMNYTYRELMTIDQMGLYLYENGFNILRHGFIKTHNGIVAKPR
ncbi:class I SAM-dependent methyltransferase [Alicyclobacillus vulcanalis]|uniref:Methyltransferase domain-containing protein n=1 Tax=Alicyclobacillus vulcanalis TaxID=252246 RepID=A0A1N7M2L0_9BACL|nr:class I SAM-dependent methyltransferase [Alicyclobacillus vulcanalis]SIS80282.1 Methyltransferase domain-containing protein [Alicyclobacillus vulcanalis]